MMNALIDQAAGPVEALSGTQHTFEELVRALLAEARLLGELRNVLLRQRDAVAADDTVSLEAAIHEIGRLLITLGEARRRRVALVVLLAGDEDAKLEQVIRSATPGDSVRLRAAQDHLKAVAEITNRDLMITQAVLRRVIETGERFLQQLFGAPESADSGYTGPGRESHEADSLFLNRRA
ncbi:MAG: flagellar export chaperone FlgN [Gemmatimonadota bacterium]